MNCKKCNYYLRQKVIGTEDCNYCETCGAKLILKREKGLVCSECGRQIYIIKKICPNDNENKEGFWGSILRLKGGNLPHTEIFCHYEIDEK